MPIYEFLCPGCGAGLTELCKMGETGSGMVCPRCEHIGLKKLVSGFSNPGGNGNKQCGSDCHGDCSGCH